VPDALLPADHQGGSVNLGYYVNNDHGIEVCCRGDTWTRAAPFTFESVELSGATAASINLNAWYFGQGATLQYRFNGGAWRTVAAPFPSFEWGLARALSVPVALADLRTGPNSLEFRGSGEIVIANIDLTIEVDETTER